MVYMYILLKKFLFYFKSFIVYSSYVLRIVVGEELAIEINCIELVH